MCDKNDLTRLRVEVKFLRERVGYMREVVEERWKCLISERDEANARYVDVCAQFSAVRMALDRAGGESREYQWERVAALVRERDEARAEVEKLSESANAAWEAECVMRGQRDRYHAEWKQERQEVERLRKAVHTRACRNQSAYNLNCVCGADEHQRDLQKLAYHRGAEAMREACAREVHGFLVTCFDVPRIEAAVRALPTPEEP